jgi:hypothetical protein
VRHQNILHQQTPSCIVRRSRARSSRSLILASRIDTLLRDCEEPCSIGTIGTTAGAAGATHLNAIAGRRPAATATMTAGVPSSTCRPARGPDRELLRDWKRSYELNQCRVPRPLPGLFTVDLEAGWRYPVYIVLVRY